MKVDVEIGPVFRSICEDAPIEALEQAVADLEGHPSPVIGKIRADAEDILRRRKAEEMKNRLRDTLAGSEAIR